MKTILMASGRVALLAVSLLTCAMAQEPASTQPAISLSQLAGSWTVSLIGQTGCGITSVSVTFTLNSTGSGTATNVGHSSGCANATTPGQPFTIQQLNSNGSGTAFLGCGTNCGWTFAIQVAPNTQTFNLVDLTDPGNYLDGDAVR